MKRGFTMLELVFVIVVIGILAGIAVPRLFVTRDDAVIAKARGDIASIRSSIINRHNTDMLSGVFAYPNLDSSATSEKLFDNVLQGGIKPKGTDDKTGWSRSGNEYTFTIAGQSVKFIYNNANGSFDCRGDTDTTAKKNLCSQLTE